MAQAKAKEAEVQSKENEVDEVQQTMYQNPYRKDLDKEVEDPRKAVEDTQEATPQETGFISKDETQPNHDYKKRYDDLKSHYDRKQNENTQKLQEMEAKLKIAEKNKAMALAAYNYGMGNVIKDTSNNFQNFYNLPSVVQQYAKDVLGVNVIPIVRQKPQPTR